MLHAKSKIISIIQDIKDLSLCRKLEFSNPYKFGKYWRKPLVFQTFTI